MHGLSESAVISLEVQNQFPVDCLVLGAVHGLSKSAAIPREVQH